MKSAPIAAALATVAFAEKASPLGQVFKLMDELSAKITAEAEEEAKQYREYFNWCDDVNKNSHFAIKTARSQKDKLEAKIGDLNANIAAGASKIEDLAAAISSATKELEEATGIRKKEKADFDAAEKELVSTIDTLNRAIKIISKEMEKNPAFAQQSTKSVAAMVQSLTTVVEAAGFSTDDSSRLTALVQSKSEEDDSDMGAPTAAVYESQSGGIVDTLEDLKEKGEKELDDLRKAETANKHNFDMLAQSLNDQLAADNKDLAEEKTNKAANEESLATATSDLSVTVKTLQNGLEELDTANTNCMRVAADHGATVKAREEELKVIAEARKIVEEATSGGASFLQLQTSSDLAQVEIVTMIKKLAKTEHSAALSQLASRITAVMRYGDDPFVKVKGLITDMIKKLEEEAAAEASKKAYCDEEMSKTEEKKGDLEAVVAKLTSKINQDSARSAELKAEVKELQASLAALASEQAEMDKMRQEAHADYVKAKEELSLGLAGVGKALGVLRDYYGAAAFVQQPAAPKTHSKATGAGQSIINLLEVCEEDFASDLAKTEAEEASRAEAYEQNTQENKLLKTTSEQDVKYKSQEATSLDKTVSELSGDRSTTQTELDAVNEYYGQLRGECIAKPETYEERKRKREAEINGLKEALTILENESAFVQRGKHRRARHMRGALTA